MYVVFLHWLGEYLPKICNIFKKPWFEYMNSSINSLDLKYYEIILRCFQDVPMLGIYRSWFNIEDKLEKLKSLISNAAIDIKLRYPRYHLVL